MIDSSLMAPHMHAGRRVNKEGTNKGPTGEGGRDGVEEDDGVYGNEVDASVRWMCRSMTIGDSSSVGSPDAIDTAAESTEWPATGTLAATDDEVEGTEGRLLP